MTVVERKSDSKSLKDTPYLALTGELWVSLVVIYDDIYFCIALPYDNIYNDSRENRPLYNGTALHLAILLIILPCYAVNHLIHFKAWTMHTIQLRCLFYCGLAPTASSLENCECCIRIMRYIFTAKIKCKNKACSYFVRYIIWPE